MPARAGPIEAEVFENERYLPFRGWGHEWPGHLLPTDRVGHWSLRGDRPSGAESMEFSHVAPPLPEVRAREGPHAQGRPVEWAQEDGVKSYTSLQYVSVSVFCSYQSMLECLGMS